MEFIPDVVVASFGTGPGGKKDDGGKLPWSLMILQLLSGVVKILEHGARKYAAQSWQKVPNGKERYFAAMIRHLISMQDDGGNINLNKIDSDSGLPHLWHMQTNAYFLEYFRRLEQ